MSFSDKFSTVITLSEGKSFDSPDIKDPLRGAYGGSRPNLDCQVQNSGTTPAYSIALQTVKQIQKFPG